MPVSAGKNEPLTILITRSELRRFMASEGWIPVSEYPVNYGVKENELGSIVKFGSDGQVTKWLKRIVLL